MNIYITQDNEAKLRQLKDYTMSGLVNYLLENYWKDHDPKEVGDYIDKRLGLTKTEPIKVIKTPEQARERLDNPQGYIDKSFSARKKR